MPSEIERKFLIHPERINLPANGTEIKQGYLPLSESSKTTMRVRVKADEGTIAVKGENRGAVRAEYEYAIPLDHALEMLESLCQKPLVEKTRYELTIGAHLWEVDVFHGDNAGLILAEVELTDENEIFERPDWLAQDVTDDARYYNSNLLQNPFKRWGKT